MCYALVSEWILIEKLVILCTKSSFFLVWININTDCLLLVLPTKLISFGDFFPIKSTKFSSTHTVCWPLTSWNQSFQTSAATSLQILVSSTDDESSSHTMSSVSPPNPPITSAPSSRLMCHGARTAGDPLLLPDCASCNMEKQAVWSNHQPVHRNTLCAANTHTHKYPQTNNLKSVHPTVNFLTASRNVFKLSDPYSNNPAAKNTAKQ